MSEIATRDFSNYYLGDDVYELADGLIPEIADKLEVDMGKSPDSVALGTLVGKLGKNKVLRDSEEVTALSSEEMADYLERSGVQKPLDRSLWRPEMTTADADIEAIILTGAVANWQDRAVEAVLKSGLQATIHLATTGRVMKTATELANPNVQQLTAELDREPNENEYAAQVILPRLLEVGYSVQILAHSEELTGDALAEELANGEMSKRLPVNEVAVFRVANAGIQLAVQMRQAIRRKRAVFDANPTKPQLYVVTDDFPIARTPEQETDAAHFQKPQTGLRQAALTAKLLHETSLSD